jgi:hypothetical protein
MMVMSCKCRVVIDAGSITSGITSYTAHREAAAIQATQWQDKVTIDSRTNGMLWKHSDQKPMVGRQPLRPSSDFAGHRVRKFHVAGPLDDIWHSESLQASHSGATNECKQCVWCGNIHRIYWDPPFDVSSTRILTTLGVLVVRSPVSGCSIHRPVWQQSCSVDYGVTNRFKKFYLCFFNVGRSLNLRTFF